MKRRSARVLPRVIWASLLRWRRPRGVAMHCGALTWSGRAVLLLGGSCSGKSTLAQLLVGSGFGFVQDQATELTPDHAVRGNLFPGWLRRPGFEAVRREFLATVQDSDRWSYARGFGDHFWVLPPRELRDRAGARLGAILWVRFSPGEEVRLEPLAEADVLALLTEEARDRRPFVHGRLREIATRTPAYRVTYGRADQREEIALRVRTLLEAGGPAPP